MVPIRLKAPPSLSSIDAIVVLFPGSTLASAEAYRREFLRSNQFFGELNNNMVEKRDRHVILEGWHEFLYVLVRLAKAQIVFETGVFDGLSSAIILQALNKNSDGMLVSVDLPATKTIKWSTHRMPETTLPPSCQPGWVIPDYLRERHCLVLGDSKELVPDLFKEHGKIDIFLHDSLHTFEYQWFEYSTAWPHLSEGGFLLSDDIFWSPAFHRFCKERNRTYVRIDAFGAAKK